MTSSIDTSPLTAIVEQALGLSADAPATDAAPAAAPAAAETPFRAPRSLRLASRPRSSRR